MSQQNFNITPFVNFLDQVLSSGKLPQQNFTKIKDIKFEVKEKDNQYLVHFDLPGVKKEEVSIEVEDNVLKVSVERKQDFDEQNEKIIHSERYYGKMERLLRFNEFLDSENISASYKDGVLNLILPKKVQSKSKKISVD